MGGVVGAAAPKESAWSIRPFLTMVMVSNPLCGCFGNPGTVLPWYMFHPSIYLGFSFPAVWVQALGFALGFVANKILLEILFADTSPRLRADQETS